MVWWSEDRLAERLPRLRQRTRIVAAIRAFFAARGFDEVETPALQVSPGLEPLLDPFSTAWRRPGEPAVTRHLHTSPEFAMKKLLAGGMTRIFQLSRVFRNGETGPTHSPEFTMLEWYRAGEGYEAIMADCEALLADVQRVVGAPFRRAGTEADASRPWRRVDVAALFAELGIDLLGAAGDRERLAAAARAVGVRTDAADAFDDIFFRIFLERIEPHLGAGSPTIVDRYPASLAALARLSAADPRVAERFELYVCGLELANAFGELTDAAEQRRRFEADLARRAAAGGAPVPIDEDFLAALARGLPESAGIALGVDRLVMLATGADHIEDVLWAPVR